MHETEPVSETLQRRVKGARRLAVVGIGDELIPADRLGMAAAREIEARHLPGVKVFFAGTVPESITGPIRRYRRSMCSSSTPPRWGNGPAPSR